MNRLRLLSFSALLASLLLLVGAFASSVSDDVAAGGGLDSDGDAFPDDWETDGTPQGLNMAALGADPDRADVFLEIDYMKKSFRKSLACRYLDKIFNMFNNAPVNVGVPGLEPGIAIHIDAGKTCPSRSYNLKRSNVATDYAQYLTPTCSFQSAFIEAFQSGRAKTPDSRLNVFHHAFIADHVSSMPSSQCDVLGVVRALPGRQLLVGKTAHDGFGPNADDIKRELAATLAHEFGHLLGLTHGGAPGDHDPFKPNHLSIMDYWQAGGIFTTSGGRKFDFQRQGLGALNEASLNEANGLGSSQVATLRAAYECLNGFNTSEGGADEDIDWNCNGNPSQPNVQANINGKGGISTIPQTLNEWALLDFGGSAEGGGEIGARSAGVERTGIEVVIPQPGDEFTLEDRLQSTSN